MTHDESLFAFELNCPVHGGVPCAALVPAADHPLPVCLFLFGGGGSIDSLAAIAPLLTQAFAAARVPPMLVASAGVAPYGFYLDDPARGMRWESLLADDLLSALGARFPIGARAGLVGISMGGYGALKIALARPARFVAVAAVAPMMEPSLTATGAPLRNRYFYPPDVPAALLGQHRDAALFERDHPAARARDNAAAIRAHDLCIWLDAGSRDACHAQDGAEFLHRTLWDLDIAHEYHLLRDADHVGDGLPERMLLAFSFVAARLHAPVVVPGAAERALRDALAPARAAAAVVDPSVERCYGYLRERGEDQ